MPKIATPTTAPAALPSQPREHQPLFVLREHGCTLLSSAFYPVLQDDDAKVAKQRSRLFLSGDVNGTVILWDLEVRQRLLTFAAIAAADEAEGQGCGGGEAEQDGTEEQMRLRAARQAIREAAAADGPVGVLAVGFIRVGAAGRLRQTAPASGDARVERQVGRQNAIAPIPRDAADANESSSSMTGRRRFHLIRRPAEKTKGPAKGTEEDDTIFFYTHCRNQRLYIWSFPLSASSRAVAAGETAPRLLFTFYVPHHGFCPVASVAFTEGVTSQQTDDDDDEVRPVPDGQSSFRPNSRSSIHPGTYVTLLALPGDSAGHGGGGVITTWRLTLAATRDSEDSHLAETRHKHLQVDKEGDGGDGLEEDVDTTGMNPMDALIARSAAKEKVREARGRAMTDGGGRGPRPLFAAGVQSTAKREEEENGGVANPLTAAFAGAVSALPTSFSVKSGVVMRMDMQAAGRRTAHSPPSILLSTSFESGHISLARLAFHSSSSSRGEADNGCRGGGSIRCKVLTTVRAFPESAMSCTFVGLRETRRDPKELQQAEEESCDGDGFVVATSAEGNVQCFYAVWTNTAEGTAPHAQRGTGMSLQPCWSASLPKGVGSICVVDRLLILGCWDGSLRLYDLRGRQLQKGEQASPSFPVPEGESASAEAAMAEGGKGAPAAVVLGERQAALVSILPFHVPSAVNEVASLGTCGDYVRDAPFAFDVRAPRLYAATSNSSSRDGISTKQIPDRCGGSGGRARETDTSSPRSEQLTTQQSPTTTTVAKHAAAREVDGGAGVHVFASASKDGRIAIWRVDFVALAEARRLLPPP